MSITGLKNKKTLTFVSKFQLLTVIYDHRNTYIADYFYRILMFYLLAAAMKAGIMVSKAPSRSTTDVLE